MPQITIFMLPKKISEIINNNVNIISKEMSYKKDFFGDTPAPFVGRFNYPNVNVGIMSAINAEKKDELDNPKLWSNENKTVDEVVNLRSSLINSRFKSNVYSKREKLNELAKEVGLASGNVETEINLEDKPHFKLNTFSYATPHGPNAQLKKAKITSNPKLNSKVERAHYDTDLKSATALNELYNKGIDENHLSQILSVGALGIGKNRKLVPTRWSITATDDTLGKQLLKDIKINNPLDNYKIYFGGIMGNYYLILMFPEIFNYELFEFSLQHPDSYSTDFEYFSGRKKYSEACEGGYYTVRMAICEKLKELNLQSTAIAIRFITPEYTAPLGVWVTREATRRCLKQKPYEFNSKEAMLDAARNIIKDEFKFNLDIFLTKSILLKNLKTQKKLFEF